MKRKIEDNFEGGLQLTKKRKFSDIKDNPLGSVKTILFWNDQQKQVDTQVVNMRPTLLMGDYGTGFFYHIIIIIVYIFLSDGDIYRTSLFTCNMHLRSFLCFA